MLVESDDSAENDCSECASSALVARATMMVMTGIRTTKRANVPVGLIDANSVNLFGADERENKENNNRRNGTEM